MLDELVKKEDMVKVFSKRQETDEILEYDIPWLLKGSIFQILSDTEMEMITEQLEPDLKKDVCYILYLYSYEKVYLCNAYYRAVHTEEGKRVVSFELLSPLEGVQRRMHQRISSHAKVFFRRVEEEKMKESLKEHPLSELIREEHSDLVLSGSYEETMVDISAGGLRFTSKERIKMREYVFLRFDIQDKEKPMQIETYGQVIYSELFRNEQGVYDIRLKFIGMPEELKERIIHYVFWIEREKRKMGGKVS